MKKTKIIGALLAGVIAASGVPEIAGPLMTTAYAESSKLPAPTDIKADYIGSAEARLTWNAVEGADGYRIYEYSSKDGGYVMYAETKLLYCYVTGLSPSTGYKFRIAALVDNSAEHSAQTLSEPCTFRTTGLEAPTDISVRVYETSVALNWEGDRNAEGYRVYRYNTKKGRYVKYKDVTEPYCLVEGLTEGKTYKFRIAALVKPGEKLKPQQKSAVITVIPTKREEFSLPEFPEYGISSTEALRFMKITNYTIMDYTDGSVMYVPGSDIDIFSGDYTGLIVDKNDVYYGAMILKTLPASDEEILAMVAKKNGKPDVYNNNGFDNYVWETPEDIKIAAVYSGMLMYVEVSYKYAPQELIDQLSEQIGRAEKKDSGSVRPD